MKAGGAAAGGSAARFVIDAAALLTALDELRGRIPDGLPPNVQAERDGPLVRTVGWPDRGFVEYRDLGGLEGAELDELIARQVRFFAERGESFEWKLHGHDRPADLADRLRTAGFVAEEQETVVVAPVAEIAREPKLPAGVSLREVTSDEDFARIARMDAQVWGEELAWLPVMLKDRRAADPSSLIVLVAEAAGEVVCSAWIRFKRDAPFATLHGGATLPAWRGRGIYRAIVARRANLAADRGCPYLQVDASDDSRPILVRLGFTAITTTTPFIWSPP